MICKFHRVQKKERFNMEKSGQEDKKKTQIGKKSSMGHFKAVCQDYAEVFWRINAI